MPERAEAALELGETTLRLASARAELTLSYRRPPLIMWISTTCAHPLAACAGNGKLRDASCQYLRMSGSLPQLGVFVLVGVVASLVSSASAGSGGGGVVASALCLGEGLELAGEVEDLSLQCAQA